MVPPDFAVLHHDSFAHWPIVTRFHNFIHDTYNVTKLCKSYKWLRVFQHHYRYQILFLLSPETGPECECESLKVKG